MAIRWPSPLADYGLLVFAVFAAVCSAPGSPVGRGQAATRLDLPDGRIGRMGRRRGAVDLLRIGAARVPVSFARRCQLSVVPHRRGPRDGAFPVGYSGHSRVRFVLDGFIVAGALFEISWVLVLRGVYEAGGTSAFAVGLSLAYPSPRSRSSLSRSWCSPGPDRRRTTLAMLTVGVMLMALSDSVFAYLTAHGRYFSGHVIDIGWAVAFLTFGMAALINRRAARRPKRRCRRCRRGSRCGCPTYPSPSPRSCVFPRTSRRRASARSSYRRPC